MPTECEAQSSNCAMEGRIALEAPTTELLEASSEGLKRIEDKRVIALYRGLERKTKVARSGISLKITIITEQ